MISVKSECRKMKCSHLCLTTPGSAKCACPEGTSFAAGSNNTVCNAGEWNSYKGEWIEVVCLLTKYIVQKMDLLLYQFTNNLNYKRIEKEHNIYFNTVDDQQINKQTNYIKIEGRLDDFHVRYYSKNKQLLIVVH